MWIRFNLPNLLAHELEELGRVDSQDIQLLHHSIDRSFAVVHCVGRSQLRLVVIVERLRAMLLSAKDVANHDL